jgi:hypothetical protein
LQFLSLLRHAKREFDQLPEEVKKWWPEDTPELGLRDLADKFIRHNEQVAGSGQLCQQTRFFCPLNYTKPCFTRDSTVYGHNSLSIASRTLKSFFFVGLVEAMETSIAMLRTKLAEVGVALSVPGLIWANKTVESESLDWLNERDSVGRRVLEANRNDERLYRCFAQRFWAQSHLSRKTSETHKGWERKFV